MLNATADRLPPNRARPPVTGAAASGVRPGIPPLHIAPRLHERQSPCRFRLLATRYSLLTTLPALR